jgi:formamidopyrimidine-DNA glycosylase
MPELPEVETIRQGLLSKIKGKKIKNIDIFVPKLVNFDVLGFKKKTIGASIINIRRRAKLIVIDLSNKNSIIIHLKLTGQLIFQGDKEKSTRAIFYFRDSKLSRGEKRRGTSHFQDKTKLIFNDTRKFGYFKLIQTLKLENFFKKQKFGPEPLEKDFTLDRFKEILDKKPRAKIKPFLLDQTNIAGIGNIYTDESLFDAGILPIRIIKTLKESERKNLYKSIYKVLEKAIKYRGSSFDAYVDSGGKKGNFAPRVKVYRRTGQKCYRCGGTIKRIVLGGRGTHFCPKCQK